VRILRFGPVICMLEGGYDVISDLGLGKIVSLDEAFKESGELETIFITSNGSAVLFKNLPWIVLSKMLNMGIKIRVCGSILLFRTPNPEETIKILKEKIRGMEKDPLEAILNSTPRETIILLTEKPLTRPLQLEDVSIAFVINADINSIYRRLLLEGPAILLSVLPEWNELVIKLYDQTDHYLENVERIAIVVEDLDLGYIIGSGWGWDYPRPMLKVPVYRMKLISWEDPKRIKFLLKGLEYLGYKRLCDIDVELQGKKLNWFEIGEFSSKFELASKSREELEMMLSDEALHELREIENKLAKTI